MSAPSTNSELLSAEQRHRLYRWARDMNPDVVLVCADAQLPRFPRNQSPVLLPGCAGEDPSLGPALLACGAQRVRVLPCRDVHPERCATGVGLVEAPRGRVLRAAEYLDATQVPVSRRALIGLGTLGHGEIVVDPNAPTMIRLAQAHQVLGAEPDTGIELDAPRLVASGCQACGVCTQLCPSSALELTVVDSVANLTQNVAACTGEQSCVASCPYGALTGSGQLQLADLVDGEVRELTSFPVSQCRRCGADFPQGEGEGGKAKTLCPTCERTTADPFSSWLPPGFTLD